MSMPAWRFRVAVAARIALGALIALGAAAAWAAEPQAPALPPGLEMLRRTERAFAKTTAEIGFRNGFLMYFAEDAVAPPSLEPARLGLLQIPAPVDPRPTSLVWEPLLGDVSQSLDLGYLTGPSSFIDQKGKKRTGVYFSIWRRDTTGLWLVVLDAGIDMPSPAPEFEKTEFHAAPHSGWKGTAGSEDAMQNLTSLTRAESEFLSALRTDPIQAFELHAASEARMHREGFHPLLGREAIVEWLQKHPEAMSGEPLRSVVAKAGDLGWTFGACEIGAGETKKKGAYSRVWKRDDQGTWRIVVDVLNPPRE